MTRPSLTPAAELRKAQNRLTPRQREVYDFIKEMIESRGYGPTLREIGEAFNIGSPNGVISHLKALEKKEWIKYQKGDSGRGIQLVGHVRESVGRTENAVAVPPGLAQNQQDDEPKDGLELPSPHEFAQQLLSGLPEDKEQGLIALSGKLDEYREAMRAGLERVFREYMRDRNPATREERQRSVDFLNGLLDRLGFSLEHPDHPGQMCYMVLSVDNVNRNGQIRLLPKGAATRPLERSAYLSHFAELRVVDGLSPLQQFTSGPADGSPQPWSERTSQSRAGKPPFRGS